MKVLMISSDRRLFEENSEVRRRIVEYGGLAEELRVIVFSKKGFEYQNFGNVFLHPTNSKNRWFYVFDAIKIAKKILAKNRELETKNRVITTQDPFEAGLAGWLIAKKFNLRLQLQIHTDFLSPYFRKESLLNRLRVLIAKFLIPRADCVRVVSNRIKNSLKSESVVLPVFVDVEEIKSAPVKINLREKYPQFDFIILMASRLSKEKNIKSAIEAMKEIVEEYPKTGLIIAGDGAERKNLKSQILPRPTSPCEVKAGGNLKIKGNIILEGWQNDLNSYYKTADLFLLTSNYEGYGRTLVSVAVAGCGIISTDVGVADEILDKDNLIKPKNKEQLKEKIIKAIKGEIKPPKTILSQTKEQYLQSYKKSWENC